MSPRGARRGGLVQAQEEIASLVVELDQTLDLVNRLSLAGEEEAAVKLIDGQRAELYRVVNSISRNVAARDGTTWIETVRKHATALAAAALLVLSTLAVSVHAITRQTPVERAERQLASAPSIVDPIERIKVLFRVIEVTRTLPPEQAKPFNQDLIPALQDAVKDAKDDGNPDPDVVREAEGYANDIQEGRTPEPPPAPGSEESPIESITDDVPQPCVTGNNDAPDC